MLRSHMVSPSFLGKTCCWTDTNLLPVDEDYYSDEDDQDPSGMDDSDDTRSLASEDDG
jgi:hypothetical protein